MSLRVDSSSKRRFRADRFFPRQPQCKGMSTLSLRQLPVAKPPNTGTAHPLLSFTRLFPVRDSLCTPDLYHMLCFRFSGFPLPSLFTIRSHAFRVFLPLVMHNLLSLIAAMGCSEL